GCGEVSRADRVRLRETVGDEVEGIVAAYASLQWNARSVARFSAEVGALGAEVQRFLVIRLANELEDMLDDGLRFSAKSENQHRGIVVDSLVKLAAAVGQPRLASALQSTIPPRRAAIEFEPLKQSAPGSYVVGPSSWRERMLPRILRFGRRLRAWT
ncbi:MAG TPA: hypothetical protein VFJ48_09345, partial [Casimicrobiaceae bacterium]|nr:hypothetical protein [Casimicrobiaceae bacterium]